MAIYFGLSIAARLVIADAYFAAGNHISNLDWDAYSDDEKKAGLMQAEREIDAHLGIALEENYSTTSWPMADGSSFRPDYAVFEHAFYLLDNTARTRTAAGGAEMIESEEYQTEEKKMGLSISPKAAMFLKINRIQVERG